MQPSGQLADRSIQGGRLPHVWAQNLLPLYCSPNQANKSAEDTAVSVERLCQCGWGRILTPSADGLAGMRERGYQQRNLAQVACRAAERYLIAMASPGRRQSLRQQVHCCGPHCSRRSAAEPKRSAVTADAAWLISWHCLPCTKQFWPHFNYDLSGCMRLTLPRQASNCELRLDCRR